MWADQVGTVLNIQELWIDRSLINANQNNFFWTISSWNYESTCSWSVIKKSWLILIFALLLPNEQWRPTKCDSQDGKTYNAPTQECQTSWATSSRATQRLDWRHLCPSSNTAARRTFRYLEFSSACNSHCPLEICPTYPLSIYPIIQCNGSLVELQLFFSFSSVPSTSQCASPCHPPLTQKSPLIN